MASLVSDEELNEDYIIPNAFDKRVADTVADQVARVAEELGIARNPRQKPKIYNDAGYIGKRISAIIGAGPIICK